MADPGAPDPWDEFCDALREAGAVLRRDATPRDELTLAEGYRHLARMIRAGFENAHELADPLHPALAPMVDPRLVYEGVTADARYLHAFIDGTRTYHVRGTRGDAPLIEIGVYTGKMGLHDPSHLIASRTEADLELDGDGGLDVVLGPEYREGNWIPTDGHARYVMIRQYAHDWSARREGRFTIELEGGDPDPPPLTLEGIRADLRRAAGFVQRAPPFWASISDYWADYSLNAFRIQETADERTEVAPPSGHRFSCGYFRLEEHQALEIRFSPGDVPFWGLGIASYWYETIGFGRERSQLNNRTAQREPDGTVRAVLSLRDPGVPNWLDPRDHREGTMIFRWSRSADPVPAIETELVALAQLRGGT